MVRCRGYDTVGHIGYKGARNVYERACDVLTERDQN